MQKLLGALAATVTLIGVVLGLTAAPVSAQDRQPAEQGQNEATSPEARAVVVPRGVTNENVEVKNRPLIIEGDLKGSVHAVNSRVTLMPGAVIEGNLTLEGSRLSVAPLSAGLISARAARSNAAPIREPKRGDWFGGQFCLWLLGLAGGLIVLFAAPNATSRVAETVSFQPGRSLVAGVVTAAAMFAALAVSGMIMGTKSFLSLLWMPVMIVIVLISLFLLVFGWLAGMRRVGDLLAHRFGQTGGGSFYGRTAFGLSAFFLANVVLGAINPALGAMGLLVEFAVALMGIGAIVSTGFGRDEEWLGRRIRRTSGSSLG